MKKRFFKRIGSGIAAFVLCLTTVAGLTPAKTAEAASLLIPEGTALASSEISSITSNIAFDACSAIPTGRTSTKIMMGGEPLYNMARGTESNWNQDYYGTLGYNTSILLVDSTPNTGNLKANNSAVSNTTANSGSTTTVPQSFNLWKNSYLSTVENTAIPSVKTGNWYYYSSASNCSEGSVTNQAYLPSKGDYSNNTSIGAAIASSAGTRAWSRSVCDYNGGGSGFRFWCISSVGAIDGGNYGNACALPASFNLTASAVQSARAASQSGNSAVVSDQLSAVDMNNITSGQMKLVLNNSTMTVKADTVKDKKLTNFVAGNTYSIPYTVDMSSAKLVNQGTDTNTTDSNARLFLTAAIYDNTGKMLYRGQIASLTPDKKNQGSANLYIPTDLSTEESYTLALYVEQISSANYSDYAGPALVSSFTPLPEGTALGIDVTPKDEDGDGIADFVPQEDTRYTKSDIAKYFNVTKNGTEVLSAADNDYYIVDAKYFPLDEIDLTTITTSSLSNLSSAITLHGGMENRDGNNVTLIDEFTTPQGQYNPEECELVFVYVGDNGSCAYTYSYYPKNDVEEYDNEVLDNKWYQSTVNGIEWNYKVDKNGDIAYLYTNSIYLSESDKAQRKSPCLTANGDEKFLTIPRTINGLTVKGIGGGTPDTPVVPTDDLNWSKISIPSSVQIINDYAFYKTQSKASVVISKNITRIGTKAFYSSNITNVRLDGCQGTVGYRAFANTPKLDEIVIRDGVGGLILGTESFAGTGVTKLSVQGNVIIETGAFKNNTKLSSLYIPNGVVLRDNAFAGCDGITQLEVNLERLSENSFAGLKNINLLILDNDVDTVDANWNGQYNSGGVHREIYVKNSATKFNGINNVTNQEARAEKESQVSANEATIATLTAHKNAVDTGTYTYKSEYNGHEAGTTCSYTSTVSENDEALEGAAAYGQIEADIESLSLKNAALQAEIEASSKYKYFNAFGSGDANVTVYVNLEHANGEDLSTASTVSETCSVYYYASGSTYTKTSAGASSDVTFAVSTNTGDEVSLILSGLADKTVSGVSTKQTGIYAACDAVYLEGQTLDNSKVRVEVVGGEHDGEVYDGGYYVMRTSKYNAILGSEKKEEIYASYDGTVVFEPTDTDTTVSLTVVLYDANGDNIDYNGNKFYTATTSVYVEPYSDEAAVLSQYEDYLAIITEINRLKADVEAYKATITALQESITGKSIELSNKEKELEEKKAQYEALDDKNSAEALELKAQIDSLESEVESLRASNESDKANLESLLTAAQEEKARLEKLLDNEEKKTDPNESTIASLEAQIKTQEALIETYTASINATKDAAAQAEQMAATIQDCNTEIAKYQAQIANLNEQLANYDATHTAEGLGYTGAYTKDGKTTHIVYINDIEFEFDPEEEGASASGIYTGTDKNGNTVKFKVLSSGVEVVTGNDAVPAGTYTETLGDMIRKANDELDKAEKDLEDITNAVNGMVDNLKSIEGFSDYLNNYLAGGSKENQVDNEMEAIREAVKDLLKDYSDVKSDYESTLALIYGKSADEIKEMVENGEIDIDKVQDALTTMSGDTDAIIETLHDILESIGKDEEGNDNVADLLNKLDNCADLLSEAESLKTQLDADASLISDIADVIGLDLNSEDQAAVLDKVKDLNTTVSSLQTANTNLESENTKVLSENELLKEENEKLKAQVESLQQQLAASENGDTTAAYNTGYQEGYVIGLLAGKSQSTTTTTTTESSYITQLNNQITSLNKKISNLEDDLDDANDDIKSLSSQVSSLSSENAALKSQVTTLGGQVSQATTKTTTQTASTGSSSSTTKKTTTTQTTEESENKSKAIVEEQEEKQEDSSSSGSGNNIILPSTPQQEDEIEDSPGSEEVHNPIATSFDSPLLSTVAIPSSNGGMAKTFGIVAASLAGAGGLGFGGFTLVRKLASAGGASTSNVSSNRTDEFDDLDDDDDDDDVY